MRSDPGFGLLVPVKPSAVAKSRLGALGEAARSALAEAFAADTVAAALRSDRVRVVLAVTDDAHLADVLRGLGAEVLPDGVGLDLNGSLTRAAAELGRRHPALRPAALCADLPALRGGELTRALANAPGDRCSFVADADGVGTTLFAAPDQAGFAPCFGPSSRERHLDQGAVETVLAGLAGLRRDVDTPADLASARLLGLGPRTARVVADLP